LTARDNSVITESLRKPNVFKKNVLHTAKSPTQGAYKFGKMKFPEFSRFSRPFE